MKKRLFALILAACFVLSCTPAYAAAIVDGDETENLIENNTSDDETTDEAEDEDSGETTDETDGETTDETEEESSGETTDETDGESSGETTDETEGESSGETTDETGGETGDETTDETNEESSGETTDETNEETSGETDSDTGDGVTGESTDDTETGGTDAGETSDTDSDGEEDEEPEETEEEPEEEDTVPPLVTDEHITYISGQGGGKVAPESSLTRAEAAQILYNLMSDQSMGEVSNDTFNDVSSDAWYYTAVMTLTSWGILEGYGDGTFLPTQAVTRQEFVKMLSAFFELETEGDVSDFSDVSTSLWSYEYLVSAVAKGWLNGYEDGTLRPTGTITRAETMTIINRALGRSADESVLGQSGIRQFIDLDESAWYYYEVLEATVEHTADYDDDGNESWSDYTMPSCGYEAGWVKLDGYLYHVNGQLQFDAYEPGFQTIDGEIFYVNGDGRIPAYSEGMQEIGGYYYLILSDGSIEALTYESGVRTIGAGIYYVNSEGKIPVLSSGITNLDGYLYLVLDDGSIDAATYDPGTVSLNGHVYYVNSEGKIPTGLTEGLQELGGELVYVQSDGTLLADASYNYLYFGEDGCYTSGSDELDDLVDAALEKAGCNDDSLTQEEKLRLAYLYMRDNFTYLSRSHHSRGSTSWTVESATFMFTYGKGNCYCFAAGFLYMARRLGYDSAYPVSGGVGSNNADHAWVMITLDGTNYMFDVELEYAYRYRYSTRRYYNLYKKLRSQMPFTYYFPS